MIGTYLDSLQEDKQLYNLKPFNISYYKSLPGIKDGIMYNKDKGKYFILCKGNVRLGIVGVIINTKIPKNFWQVYIDKKHRRSGQGLVKVGSTLVAKQLGIKELTATIKLNNKASMGAHKKAGFVEIGTRYGERGTASFVKKF